MTNSVLHLNYPVPIHLKTRDLHANEAKITYDFSNKKLKKLYPDLKFISHFIRNLSDLKLKMLFLIAGHYCFIKTMLGLFMRGAFISVDSLQEKYNGRIIAK